MCVFDKTAVRALFYRFNCISLYTACNSIRNKFINWYTFLYKLKLAVFEGEYTLMIDYLLLRQVKERLKKNDYLPADVKDLLETVVRSCELGLDDERIKNTVHLETSQRVAKIGSWEMDIPDINDLTKNRHYWSSETYRIFGFPPGSPIHNDSFYNRIPVEDQQHIQVVLEKALATKGAYDVTHRLILPGNIEKIVNERAEIIYDENTGLPVRMIGTVQDITERERAESDLKLANDHLRTLFENMQEVFYSIDMRTYQLLQMSSACEKVYGYTVEEFEKNSNLWLDVILEEDKHVIAENQVPLNQGKPIVNIYRIHHRNGSIRWMESKLTPTMDEDGKIIRLDGFTSDITQRKETEEALKNSEHKFRSLIENAVDAILVVDEKLRLTYASSSIERITGYTIEEIMRKEAFSRIHEEDKLHSREVFQKVLHNPGKTIEHTYRQIRKDGTIIWCEGSAINMLHDDAIKGIVVNFRDVTIRKEYEDALRQSNEELKKSNNELDKFVYSVSHDLRAPLSSIIGMVELIEADATDEMLKGDLKLIKDSINKLDGFILDILDYSRNSRTEIRPQEIQFTPLVNDIVKRLKYMTPENRPVDISVTIDEQAVFYSDNSRISIILNNLVSNAIRYSDYTKPQSFININIATDAEKAIISIKDNGIGINREKHEKIFEIFYRVSKVSKGSGLGLYILKETVEKLGGTIQLYSELAQGSEFVINLPNLNKLIN